MRTAHEAHLNKGQGAFEELHRRRVSSSAAKKRFSIPDKRGHAGEDKQDRMIPRPPSNPPPKVKIKICNCDNYCENCMLNKGVFSAFYILLKYLAFQEIKILMFYRYYAVQT